MNAHTQHKTITINGGKIFYREAGPTDAPVVLCPHGYPSSSFEFRNFMPALADRWRVIAPDLPGFGYSDVPASFQFTFDGYSKFLVDFVDALDLNCYVIYLHDYGSQFGFRLAMTYPRRVRGLIIQNGDIYEDQHGPKYAPLKEYWKNPTAEGKTKIAEAVSKEGFKSEFIGEVPDRLAGLISPDLWELSWSQVGTPERSAHLVDLLADQGSTVPWFERQQQYLRANQPPTLIVWGPHDGYMPEGAGRAYLRDLPDAELHVLDAGHWALETNLDEIVSLTRAFLGRLFEV